MAGAPYIIIELLGHTPVEYGLMIMVPATGYMAGNFISGRYSERVGSDRMMALGGMMTVLGSVAIVGFAAAGARGRQPTSCKPAARQTRPPSQRCRTRRRRRQ